MLEMGILVALGLLVLLAKVRWTWKLWVVSHPVLTDVVVFTFLVLTHWGTFSGVMVASIGALFCSITLSVARWLIGHVENGVYLPGKFNVIRRL